MGRITHWFGTLYLAAFARLSPNSWRPLPRPDDSATVARGAGHDPDRVLLLGRGSAIGWGVVSHELALAGHLARATSLLTGRGIDVEVIADPEMSVRAAARALTPAVISRFDAIVLTLGTREAFEFLPVKVWTRQLTHLLDLVETGRAAAPAIVIVGAEERPPVPMPRAITGPAIARARAINAASRAIAATRNRTRYVDSAMEPENPQRVGLLEDDFVAVYARSAQAVAPALAGLLEASPARLPHPVDEAARHTAVAYLRRHLEAPTERISVLLTTLQNVLDVRSVDLFFVDSDEVRLIAATSPSVENRPRKSTLSNDVLEHRGGFQIADLSADARFRHQPYVTGEPHLRFYAGHPVESPDGHRVAVLSVVDTRARELSPSEAATLRHGAIRVGELLFEGYRGRA